MRYGCIVDVVAVTRSLLTGLSIPPSNPACISIYSYRPVPLQYGARCFPVCGRVPAVCVDSRASSCRVSKVRLAVCTCHKADPKSASFEE